MKTTCGIFLINIHTKQLLVCKPNNNEAFWSIPKGIAEGGEDHLTAAKRELEEETSIKFSKLDVEKVIDLGIINYEKRKKALHSYVVYFTNETAKIKLDCKSMIDDDPKKGPEIVGYKWVSIESAMKMLHEAQVKALKTI